MARGLFFDKKRRVLKIISLVSFGVFFTSLFFQNCSNKFKSDLENLGLGGGYRVYTDLVTTKSSSSLATAKVKDISSQKLMSELGITNFGFHMGGVTPDNRPLVEEYLMAQKDPSPWYFAQWKKIRPLRPSTDLTQNTQDGFIFKVKNSGSNESSINAYLEPGDKVVYEITSKQGYLTSVGGSNIFLSADLKRREKLNREIVLNFDTRLKEKMTRVKPEFSAQSSALLQRDISGFFIGGFPVAYSDGNPENSAGLFIQFYVTDTRMNSPSDPVIRYRGFYPHGNYTEIVATLPIHELSGNAADIKYGIDNPRAAMQNIRFSLNRLLCMALNGAFNRTDGLKQESLNFANFKNGLYVKNLSGWSVGSLYLGLETQAAFFDESQNANDYFYPSSHPLYGAHDVRQDIKDRMVNNGEFYKGDISLSVEVSDISLKAEAEPFTTLNSCDDVFRLYGMTNPNDNLVEEVICQANSVTASGCSAVANGVNQRTCNASGTAYGSCSLVCNSGYQNVNGSCQQIPAAAQCTYGAGINTSVGEAYEWMCDCTSANSIFNKGGWITQTANCSHRVANYFCNAGKRTYYACDQQVAPAGLNWVDQGGGCYHWASQISCQ